MRSRTRTHLTSKTRCTAGRRAAFRLLLRAWNMACEIRRSPWSLAVELEAFVAEHIPAGDLHWLVSQGYAEQRIETTRLGSRRRTFRATGPAFTVRSCFVLTERGIQASRQYGAESMGRMSPSAQSQSYLRRAIAPTPVSDGRRARPHRKGRAKRAKPRWDGQLRQLWLDRVLVKRFRVPAGNQEAILTAFQEQRWPVRIDDPLPCTHGTDPKERLHATIRRLNGRQLRRLLRFMGDGTGTGVCWEMVDGVVNEQLTTAGEVGPRASQKSRNNPVAELGWPAGIGDPLPRNHGVIQRSAYMGRSDG